MDYGCQPLTRPWRIITERVFWRHVKTIQPANESEARHSVDDRCCRRHSLHDDNHATWRDPALARLAVFRHFTWLLLHRDLAHAAVSRTPHQTDERTDGWGSLRKSATLRLSSRSTLIEHHQLRKRQ